jgi:hypothetical protein
MTAAMEQSGIIAKYLPWTVRREKERQQRVAALRQRDGDDCRRCRRPMRFDLVAGHDLGPKVERIESGDIDAFENFCLTHMRCNAQSADNTAEVTERVRRKNEAELFTNSRRRA